ncbi:YqcC family protein [Vibrio europaeus]|uniref:Pseudouridine synthase n=1 Tax=Vibrio europaeus TaxID=300876 RepID=A0A178JBZ0_9VIBR|nr:YqcC family protein [Vibrio europaeus]MDC5703529.1 YqcC family protein [Vibrio europaeus]MDC5711316.1 YqcC family protein [Vibrio europaeus]MDC5714809.1 YqcC family protein [Vibrio europaeus]MDC5722291.1 YqcC family protein [Vibrio europaeus]MDC5727428.1 YqcC family protein [Vibrio europaeus]
MTKEKQLAALIDCLELSMKQLELWCSEQPSEQALASQQPFALDTLEPQAWLQWVFIRRVRVMLEQEQPLPSGFSLSPYFEECWKEQSSLHPLIEILRQIDEECR